MGKLDIQKQTTTINAYEAFIDSTTNEFLDDETNVICKKIALYNSDDFAVKHAVQALVRVLVKKGTLRLEDFQ